MQSLKDSKQLEQLQKLFNWLLSKIKSLLWYVLKHPLGSILWVIKAYFALMFLSLFVACSFGAFAADLPPDLKPAQLQKGVECQAKKGSVSLGNFKGTDFPDCRSKAAPAILKTITLPPASSTSVQGSVSTTVTNSVSPIVPTPTSGSVGYKIVETSVKTVCSANDLGQTTCTTKPPTVYNYTLVGTVNKLGETTFYICPPDMWYEYTQGPDKNNMCSKPIGQNKKCWPDGGNWESIPIYHFSDSTSSQICAKNDKGESCAWRKASKGVFIPDANSPLNCADIPPEEPPKKPDCTTGGGGMKVCPADPNDRCKANSSGAVTCDANCGYVNGVFACFDHPGEKGDKPEIPDKKPTKEVDDKITDPNKAVADMVKSDLKDIFGGAEDRLDNLLTAAENQQNSNEALLSGLNANGREANRRLASIDENTKGIKDNTKGILDSLTVNGDAEGIEKPELGKNHNKWESRNFGTIMKAKGDELMALPLFASVKNFFNVSFAGACPQYSVSVWVFELSVDQFCNATMDSIWPYIKAVVLLVCSFFAIRIALL